MINASVFLSATVRALAAISLLVAAILAVSIPALAYAATFAYVNQAGEVSTVVADNGMMAISIAPNIDEHSGVILLDSLEDNALVGDMVPGV